MPDFAIVDSHVHLYDIERFRYGWLDNVPRLKRTSLIADYDRARGPIEVDKIVFAEVAIDPGLHLAEAEFVQGLADTDARLCAMVAHAPLEKGAAIEANWETIQRLTDDALVTTLAMVCPFEPAEKQALLEAPTDQDRAATLLALLQMGALAQDPSSGRSVS